MTTINRLKEVMSAASEPAPKPLPEQDSRVGEAMAAKQDDINRGSWRGRVREAEREIIAALPDLLATITRLESENAEVDRLFREAIRIGKEHQARALAAEKRLSEGVALLRDYMFAEEIDDPAERGGELLVCRNKVEAFLKEPTNANG